MKLRPLRPQSIFGLADYSSLDSGLVAYLRNGVPWNEFEIGHYTGAIGSYFRFADEVYWRPGRKRFMIPSVAAGSRIHVSVVMHESIHYLFYRKLKRKVLTDATATVLAESTASCIDIYFGLLIASRVGWKASEFFKRISLKKYSARDLRTANRQLREIKEGRSASEIFHEYQIDFFRAYRGLFADFERDRGRSNVDLRRMAKVIESMKNPWILNCFDFFNNVYFASRHAEVQFSPAIYRRAIDSAATADDVPTQIDSILKVLRKET